MLKAIAEQLPAHYLYFGDTARLPYGTKSAETVARYAIGATHFLEAQNIDLLVIACNTATALALPQIKAAAHVPVVGVVEPGAAMAAEVSEERAAIVIATEATVAATPIATRCSVTVSTRWRKPARCSCRWSKKDGSSIRSPNKSREFISTKQVRKLPTEPTSWCCLHPLPADRAAAAQDCAAGDADRRFRRIHRTRGEEDDRRPRAASYKFHVSS